MRRNLRNRRAEIISKWNTKLDSTCIVCLRKLILWSGRFRPIQPTLRVVPTYQHMTPTSGYNRKSSGPSLLEHFVMTVFLHGCAVRVHLHGCAVRLELA